MIEIDGSRLWASLMDMSEIGRLPNGGCQRLALSDEDRAARDLFVRWAKEAGAEVKFDSFGNIFAIRAGSDPARPVVLTGSHLDTQPSGGHFDGVFGVLAGLEVLRAMNDCGYRTNAPIGVVNWANEEGVRFSPGLTGSSAFAGHLDRDEVLGLEAVDGARFGNELDRIGYAGPPLSGELPLGAYIEAHIEQGPILEDREKQIGIVNGIQGVRWYEISIEGVTGHAGTMPMDSRQDAFMAAAGIAAALRDAATALSRRMRITFGRIYLRPGSTNTIPGQALLTMDLRHPDEAILTRLEELLPAILERISQDERVAVDWRRTMVVPSVQFDARCVAAIQGATDSLGYSWERMTSGAMHDASSISLVTPTAMLFVPCKGGISHHEAEWVEPEDVTRGCRVLAEAVRRLAMQELP